MKKKLKIKCIIAIVLSLALLLTSLTTQNKVIAAENINSQIVYVNGHEICVSVNAETGIITAQSTDTKDDSYLEISNNGDNIVNIFDETEKQYEDYELEIEDFSYTDMDIDVIDDSGNIVESFDNPNIILNELHKSRSAVAIVTGITIKTLITAVLKAAACIAVAGVIYYGAKAAVKAISKSSSKKRYYYKAYIYNKNVFISIKSGISKASAIKLIKSGKNVYTYTASLAKSVVTATGKKCSAKEISCLKGKVRLWHYHTVPKNGSHIFFGTPVTY